LAIRQKKQREFIAVADEIYHGKTLYLDSKMVINYLQPLVEKNKEFMILDSKGRIIDKIEENQEKSPEIEQNELNNNDKVSKTIDFTKKVEENKESKWAKYRRRKELND
jgi:hypothetical protein